METIRKPMVRYAVVAVAVVLVAAVVTVVVLLLVRNADVNSGSQSTGTRVTESLRFIVVVSRHGNRASNSDYLTDPYSINDTDYWPYGVFALTPKGRVQMYKLGTRVRALYDGFLNSTFDSEELHASSTYMDRMLMSGEAFLAGLYPPRGWQLWNTNIPWQPTPIYSDSPDKTIDIEVDCAKFDEDFARVREDFLESYAANITDMIRVYNNATGSSASAEEAASILYYMWDKLISEDTEGYSIPAWTKALYPEPLQNLVTQEYIAYYAGTDDIARLLIGSLFDEVLDVMKSVINGTQTERKVQYYSGHDSSIVALQLVIGIPRASIMGMVKPGSAMIFELHQNSTSGQFSVQTVYIDGSSSDLALTNVAMTECGDPCVFDSLVNISLPFTGVDYEAECQNISGVFNGHSREDLHQGFLDEYDLRT